ncbi:hypothetical protein ACFSCZ_01920 [Siminovitchia sediminis]|uniref:Uncharacterized protein n=1 Tax=Siminovitchia sediminis TaxID=1274353 RepID=A0ABW4KH60_9BACI
MRINDKGRFAGTSMQDMDGLHWQNTAENEQREGLAVVTNEAGVDHTSISFMKKELERG